MQHNCRRPRPDVRCVYRGQKPSLPGQRPLTALRRWSLSHSNSTCYFRSNRRVRDPACPPLQSTYISSQGLVTVITVIVIMYRGLELIGAKPKTKYTNCCNSNKCRQCSSRRRWISSEPCHLDGVLLHCLTNIAALCTFLHDLTNIISA